MGWEVGGLISGRSKGTINNSQVLGHPPQTLRTIGATRQGIRRSGLENNQSSPPSTEVNHEWKHTGSRHVTSFRLNPCFSLILERFGWRRCYERCFGWRLTRCYNDQISGLVICFSSNPRCSVAR